MTAPTETRPHARYIDGQWCVVVPVADDTPMLASLLEWANAWRQRNAKLLVPQAFHLARALRVAVKRQAEVPTAEPQLAADDHHRAVFRTTAEAAQILGIGERAVRKRIARQQLPATLIGTTYLIELEDLRPKEEIT